jgi:prephenate dehydrogenase
MTGVALLGYGRFGRALGALFSNAQIHFRALDVGAEVPSPHRAPSLRDLVAGAQFVIAAVPVPQLAEALSALKPHLSSEQIVFDVGSVKAKPAEVFSQILGSNIPWVGTHPLFGPASLSAKEQPLKAVVCPSPDHPLAAESVADLYRQIGCEVIQQSPVAHDRVMALTQALTYFLAEGVAEVCSGVEVPFATPSFLGLMELVNTIRADGPALFTVIQRENPQARAVRGKLIETLIKLGRTLDEPTDIE